MQVLGIKQSLGHSTIQLILLCLWTKKGIKFLSQHVTLQRLLQQWICHGFTTLIIKQPRTYHFMEQPLYPILTQVNMISHAALQISMEMDLIIIYSGIIYIPRTKLTSYQLYRTNILKSLTISSYT
jgi:hypothetical protein